MGVQGLGPDGQKPTSRKSPVADFRGSGFAGLGCRVWGLRFGVWGLGVSGLICRGLCGVWGFGPSIGVLNQNQIEARNPETLRTRNLQP